MRQFVNNDQVTFMPNPRRPGNALAQFEQQLQNLVRSEILADRQRTRDQARAAKPKMGNLLDLVADVITGNR
jgi:hypothetical protein